LQRFGDRGSLVEHEHELIIVDYATNRKYVFRAGTGRGSRAHDLSHARYAKIEGIEDARGKAA